MSFLMDFQSPRSFAGKCTKSAFKGSLFRMNPLMHRHMRGLTEVFVAKIALVRFFTSVHAHVAHEQTIVKAHIITTSTSHPHRFLRLQACVFLGGVSPNLETLNHRKMDEISKEKVSKGARLCIWESTEH